MQEYATTVRIKYNHCTPSEPQHSPHAHHEIIYAAKEQLLLPDADTSHLLDDMGIKHIRGIVGSLLYYAKSAVNKVLVTLSTISS